MSVIYGIKEIHPDGSVYIANTTYKSRKKAEMEKENLIDAFPGNRYVIISFWLV